MYNDNVGECAGWAKFFTSLHVRCIGIVFLHSDASEFDPYSQVFFQGTRKNRRQLITYNGWEEEELTISSCSLQKID